MQSRGLFTAAEILKKSQQNLVGKAGSRLRRFSEKFWSFQFLIVINKISFLVSIFIGVDSITKVDSNFTNIFYNENKKQ